MLKKLITDDFINTTGYKFSELFNIEEIQKLQDLFSVTTGVASIITEPDGTPITIPSGFCSLCNKVIRETKQGRKNCLISDSIIGSPQQDGPKIQRCLSGGLLDGGVSIIIDGNHIANWIIGQVIDEDYKTEELLAYADVIGVEHDIYLKELKKVKHMSMVQFENVCKFLFINAQLLTKYSIKNRLLTHDINEKIIKEVEIKNINLELENMVVARTSQLENINNELEEANVLLKEEILERQKVEKKIKKLNEGLEAKVEERTKTLRMSEENLRITLQSIGDGVITTDTKQNVQMLNNVAEYMTGWTKEEAVGKPFLEVFNISHENKSLTIKNPVKEVLETNNICELANHAILTSKDGSLRNVADSAAPIKDIYGNTKGVVMVFRDVTQRKKIEEEIIYLSYHDQLTGLYNRRFYEKELKRLDVEINYPITIIMADVNGLKLTNDAFGHKAGDILLEKISNILKKECHSGQIVARIGGDEFVLLLTRKNTKAINDILNRINEAILKDKTEKIILSVSVGYATKDDVSVDMNDIFRKAEDYMYRHKLSERSSIRSKTIDLIMNSLYEKNNREMLHSKRVSEICEAIAKKMNFGKDDVNQIRITGLMHDIGKIGVNDNILNKVEKLNNDEWEEIKRHSEIGYRILSSVNEFWQIANYVLEHHERWDGKGYPKALKGEEISIEARIIAVADSYDAMTSDRAYRKALSEEEAIKELKKYSGTQFDPAIVKIFVEKV